MLLGTLQNDDAHANSDFIIRTINICDMASWQQTEILRQLVTILTYVCIFYHILCNTHVKADNLQYNTVGRWYDCPIVWWTNYYFDRLRIIQWNSGLVTQPMMQRWLNQTEKRTVDSYSYVDSKKVNKKFLLLKWWKKMLLKNPF